MNETETNAVSEPFAERIAQLDPQEQAHLRATVATQTAQGNDPPQLRVPAGKPETEVWDEELSHAAEDRDKHLALFEQRVLIDLAGAPYQGPTKYHLLEAVLSAQRRFEAAQKGRRRAVLASEYAAKRSDTHAQAETLRYAGRRAEADLLEAKVALETDMSGNKGPLRARIFDLEALAAREAAVNGA
jgi:hypothetical protein